MSKVTVEYKGYTIILEREQSCGGDELLYFSIFKGDTECLSDFTSGEDTIDEMIGYLQYNIDAEIENETYFGLESKE